MHNPTDEDNLLMSPIIERNSALPTSKVEKYYTVSNGQDRLRIQEYIRATPCIARTTWKLGELDLPVPPAPAAREGAAVRLPTTSTGFWRWRPEPSTQKTISTVLVGRAAA